MANRDEHAMVAELAAFGSSVDRRQLYARDLRRPPDDALRYIAEGEAPELRADCRAGHLVCPVPACPLRSYTTVGGSRRDHFRHITLSGGHGPEGYYHTAAKHLVGSWARKQLPHADVWIDARSTGDRATGLQRPDVLVQLNERQIAFEIQYAPITSTQWLNRHLGYERDGITDIWLWGHSGAFFRADRTMKGRVALTPAQQLVVASRQRLFWINPELQSIATQLTLSDPWWRFEHRVRSALSRSVRQKSAEVAFAPLTECTLDDDGFATPALTAELALRPSAAQALLRDRARQRRREAARRADMERREAAASRRAEALRPSPAPTNASVAELVRGGRQMSLWDEGE